MDVFLELLSYVDELIELSKRVISTLLSAGFQLKMGFTEISAKLVSLDLHTPTIEKSLGTRMLKSLAGCLTELSASDFY